MPFTALAPELVPLVHHIELAKAGWGLRLTEQLATAVACSSGQTASAADLRFSIEKKYGVRTTEADVRRAVGTLASKKILLEVEPGRFKASGGAARRTGTSQDRGRPNSNRPQKRPSSKSSQNMASRSRTRGTRFMPIVSAPS